MIDAWWFFCKYKLTFLFEINKTFIYVPIYILFLFLVSKLVKNKMLKFIYVLPWEFKYMHMVLIL